MSDTSLMYVVEMKLDPSLPNSTDGSWRQITRPQSWAIALHRAALIQRAIRDPRISVKIRLARTGDKLSEPAIE